MKAIQESFCQIVLDPQFVDVGVSHQDRDWRIVVARPLLSARLGDWQTEGQKLLAELNIARSKARQCGTQPFGATAPLTWNATLATAAEAHARNMANKTSSTTRTRMAAHRATGRNWRATTSSRSARPSPPGKTPCARWSMAGWPAPAIAPT
jgi:uncharacterized protein YkwD